MSSETGSSRDVSGEGAPLGCQNLCECLCKMADVSEMFGLADACRGLFYRAKSAAEGARRHGEGTAKTTRAPSEDFGSRDCTRLDHMIALLRAEMIDLISLDVDVLRQFLHVYEEIEDLKLQRQFASRQDGYDSASTYSWSESGSRPSSMESLQSVGRPLSGGFENAVVYQSKGSNFLEVPRKSGSWSPKLGSPRLRRPFANCFGTSSQSTTDMKPSPTEGTVPSQVRCLPEDSKSAGKTNDDMLLESKHGTTYNTEFVTRVHAVPHHSKMQPSCDERTSASQTVPSIEVTAVQDSNEKFHDHSTQVYPNTLLAIGTSSREVVTSESPPQLPIKERRKNSILYKSMNQSCNTEMGLDEETARLIRTCEEYILISDRTPQAVLKKNNLEPNVQNTASLQNGYNQSWAGSMRNFSRSERRDLDVMTERALPACRMQSMETGHDHACAQGEGDYMVMLPIIRVTGH